MMILGVDVGKYGALALHDGERLLRVEDMPLSGGEVDSYQLAVLVNALVASAGRSAAFVERQHAMPKQGVATTFALGRRYGTVLGVLGALCIPLELPAPHAWKSALKLAKGKDTARQRASQLMPEGTQWWARVRDHGRAEAALIAWFGARHVR